MNLLSRFCEFLAAAFALVSLALAAVPATAGAQTPAPAKSAPVASEIDALRLIEPAKHSVAGEWKFEKDRLECRQAERARIEIPHAVPDQYDLEAVVERLQGDDALAIGLVAGGRRFSVHFDGYASSASGLHMLDGKGCNANETAFKQPLFKNGTTSTLVIAVRSGRIKVHCDGKQVVDWSGEFKRLSLYSGWNTPANRLFVGAHQSSYRIHRLTLRPLAAAETPQVAAKMPAAGQGVRVALLHARSAEAQGANPLLDLAEARLSTRGAVQLVERRNIERVLAELRLSNSGLANPESALKLGAILSADVLAVIFGDGESYGANRSLGLVVFDAGTGLRLEDRAVGGKDDAQTADGIAVAVEAAVGKYGRLLSQVRTVSALPVRNADLPPDQDGFCQAVGLLIERRLTALPDVAVFERGQAAKLRAERALAPRTQKLLGSLHQMQVEVGRDAGGGILATIVLSDPQGKELGKIQKRAARNEIAALVREAANGIAELLGQRPAGTAGDPAQEAARFLSEARLFQHFKALEQSRAAAEVAFVLAPDEPRFWPALAAIYLESARNFAQQEDLSKALSDAQQGMDLYRRAMRSMSIRPYAPLWFRNWTSEVSSLYQHAAVAENASLHANEIAAFRRSFRAALVDDAEPRYRKLVQSDLDWSGYSRWLSERHSTLWISSDSAADFSRQTAEWLRLWLALVKSRPRGLDKTWTAGDPVNEFIAYHVHTVAMLLTGYQSPWQPTVQDLTPLTQVYDELIADPHPTLQTLGRLGKLAWELHASRGNEAASRQAYEAFYAVTAQSIAANDLPPVARAQAYLSLMDAADLLGGYGRTAGGAADIAPRPATIWPELQRVAELMIGRNELVDGVVFRAGGSSVALHGHTEPEGAGPGLTRLRFRTLLAVDPPWEGGLATQALAMNRRLAAQVGRKEVVRLAGRFDLAPWLEKQRAKLSVEASDPPAADVTPIAAAPWMKARKLLDAADTHVRSLAPPLVVGDAIFVVGEGFTPERPQGFYQIARFDARTGERTLFKSVDWPIPRFHEGVKLDGKWNETTWFQVPGHFQHQFCVDETHLYTGHNWRGIMRVPLGAGHVEWIGVDEGLPAPKACGLTLVDKKLIVTLREPESPYTSENEGRPAESYIAAYDWGTKSCRVLASSKRLNKQSPLDGLPHPLRKDTLLFPDASGRNVRFYVTEKEVQGMWTLHVPTGKFTKEKLDGAFDCEYHWPDRTLLAFGSSFDQRYVGLTVTADGKNYDVAFYNLRSAVPAAERVPGGVYTKFEAMPPFLPVDGWVWTGTPFGRISADGKQQERFPVLEKRTVPSQWAYRLDSLIPVGNSRRVVYGTRFSVWLLELPLAKRDPK